MTDVFDLAVLGLGPGGEDVAGAMAAAGHSVLGIEPRLAGGECPYFGCIPSKMILRAAGLLAEARRIPGMAGQASVTPDYTPVADRIRDEATDDWDDHVAVERLEGKGGVFVRGAGRLAGRDGDHLLVDVGDTRYRARRVVIATGTAPALPPIEGLGELRADLRARGDGVDGLVWTNREAIRARTAPPSLVVIGGGAIGCELAQGFARFGSRVTVIEGGPRLLAPEEPEASAVVADVFARENITVALGNHVRRVATGGDGVDVTLADGSTHTGTKILIAAGRRPNLADLGLDTIGLDPGVRILDVDDHMAVQGPDGAIDGVFALGDVTGRGGFTHVAVWQSRVLTAHLLGEWEPFGGYEALAWATFTEPEVGRVGLSEAQARERGLNVRVGVAQIAADTRGWIHGPGNDGFVKLVEDADRGVLVGATVVSPYGGELLGMLTVAVHGAVAVNTLRTMHYVFPTLHRTVSEALADLH